ncbi:hypothetical protein WME77_39425 [Sorangium sp. So ce764]
MPGWPPAVLRGAFAADTHVSVDFGVQLRSGRWPSFGIEFFGAEYERRYPSGPLRVSPFDRRDVLPWRIEIALGGSAGGVEIEAAIASMQVQQDIEDFLTRLCAP